MYIGITSLGMRKANKKSDFLGNGDATATVLALYGYEVPLIL